ncbi:MAG TPA: hypothetical protein VN081_04905 [Dongiaceae bacterium]|nr:hypothetical protein [Dongiaceae bacterium]
MSGTEAYLAVSSAKFKSLEEADSSLNQVSHESGFVFGYVDKEKMRHVSFFQGKDLSKLGEEESFTTVKGIRRQVELSRLLATA